MNIGQEVFLPFDSNFEESMQDLKIESIVSLTNKLADLISALDEEEKIDAINGVKEVMHNISPFRGEPVDFVKWVKNDDVVANDYNPNKVAPTEMKLLELSIVNDGYTQPIVTWSNEEKGKTEVIDGFHRNRVGRESKVVSQRVRGYLPIVDIRKEQTGKNDRIASTIRHNRARGKHQIDAMSEIVIELKNRNWRNARIAKELGMDEEEVLRLCQISGLEQLFNDADFSRAWEVGEDGVWEDLTDEVDEETIESFRIPNQDNEERIFHTYDNWECHKAGFYASTFQDKKAEECETMYKEFLSDDSRFRNALQRVITEWKHSCEHYLTNPAMNRIAWLGQASMCIETGVPSKFCSGFNLLSEEEQQRANQTALEYLNIWMQENGKETLDMDTALSAGRQVEIY